jgi:hypothetical protein
MHTTCKPVRKCNGCGLNFRDHCGVFDNPHDMWHSSRKKCSGYGNDVMLAEYEAREAKKQVKEKKEQRKVEARERQATQHQNGDRHVSMAAP